jgi:glycosyltransferase involved in cell wall biosynthesis
MGDIKICHLSSAHQPFDTRIFRKECTTLAAAGYNTTFIAGHDHDEVVNGVRIVALPRLASRRRRMTETIGRLYHRALDLDAALYHFHDPELMPIGLALQRNGRPVIYDVHENHVSQMASKPWLPRSLRSTVAAGTWMFEYLTIRRCAAVVVAGKDIEESFRGKARRLVRIENFPIIEPELFARQRPTKKGYTLANFGGVSSARMTGEIIAALGSLPASNPVRMVLGGRTKQPDIEESCRREPGWRRVDPVGMVDKNEMVYHLGGASAAIVLFSDQPNHRAIRSNRLYESLAAGLPVIVSDFLAWREFVEEYRCGICVDPHDPRAISSAILHLVDHPEEGEEMGRRGRWAVQHLFNWEHEAEKLLTLYRDLVGSPGSETTQQV